MTPDTIKFKCHRRITHKPLDWKYTESYNSGKVFMIMSNPVNDVRLICERTGDTYDVIYVEAELPKMLFGHNGRLIKSQDETDLALEKLFTHLDTVSVPTRPQLIECFTRIDLAWHFPLKFEEIASFYRNAYIHGIRSKPVVHKTGIHFKGTDLDFVLYDKCAQMEYKKLTPMTCNHVLRVEYRLRGDKLKQYLGVDGKYPTHLDFQKLNHAYRSLLFTSYPAVYKSEGKTIVDFLALLNKRFPEYPQFTADYCETKELHQDVSSALITMESFDWKKYLPEQGFPAPLEVYTLEEALQSHSVAEAAVTA